MILSEDRNLRIAAARLRVAVMLVMLLIAAALLIAWIGSQIGFARVEIRSHEGGALNPLLTGTAIMVLAEIALWRLAQMLKAIAEGESFTSRVTGHFRSFAWWLMLMAIAHLAIPLVSSLAGAGDGAGSIRIAVDLSSVILLGVTLLLFLLARLLEHARGIEEENREIV